jgi:hypothetical protein
MDVEHWDLSHGFGNTPKAMSKTARLSSARTCRFLDERPAILPWPPNSSAMNRHLCAGPKPDSSGAAGREMADPTSAKIARPKPR